MGEELRGTAVRRPTLALAIPVCLVAIVLWGYLHLFAFADVFLPLTYMLPLMLCLWHRDRRLLWAMSVIFACLAYTKLYWFLPDSDLFLEHRAFAYATRLINITVGSIVLDFLLWTLARLAHRNESLQAANHELESANEELAAREEEISGQNEELQAQSEELAQHNEELRSQGEELEQQNEELATQAEELRVMGEELTRREEMLQSLLKATCSLDLGEKVLGEVCRHGLTMLGKDVVGAAVVCPRGDMLSMEAYVGRKATPFEELRWPLRQSLAHAVIQENRTGCLEDVSVRPDLILPRQDGVMFRSILAAPLRVLDVPVGAVEFYGEHPRAWTEDDFRLAEWVAAQCSVVMEIVQLRGELEKQSRDRERLLTAERAARMDNEKLVRLKDEFLATVSHELRSPLSAIVGWTALLARSKVETAKAADIIQRSASSLSQLVEDLLDMSRIVSGKVRLNVEPVNVSEIVGKAVEAVQFSAEAKSIQVGISLDPGLPSIECDPNRIQQIIWNLLTNAIKFTPHGGKVNLDVAEEDRSVIISVRDTGKGIAPEFLPHLFERFRQEDGGIARKHGGLGLGLSIVKHLVELHGGTLEVQSEGKDKGATFVVRLPRPSTNVDRPLSEPSLRDTRPASPVSLDECTLSGITVLAVDDDLFSRELIARVLSDAGAAVHMAETSAEAMALLDEFRPDVLISDVGMPDEDGFAFMKAVRTAGDWRAKLPAIAVTALGRPEDRELALQAGYNEHVRKPFDPGMLCMTIRQLVRDRRADRASAEAPGRPEAALPSSGEQPVSVPASVLEPPPLRRPHILLAEDNPTISEMLRAELEENGYHVSVTDSIADGLAIARESAVDVLLSDLRLKDGMGWDLLARLHDKGKIPGIMMSGYADKAYIARSKKAGFAEYLVKPVDGDVLLSAISRMLDQSPTE